MNKIIFIKIFVILTFPIVLKAQTPYNGKFINNNDTILKSTINNDSLIYRDSISPHKDYSFTPLDKDELSISKILDSVNNKRTFSNYFSSLIDILSEDYVPLGKFEYGPLLSSININGVEGIRLQTGGRMFLGTNNRIKLQGYTAYGFKDKDIKYGILGKTILDPKNRIILFAEHRKGIEEPQSNITESNIFLGKSISPCTIPAIGNTKELIDLNSTALGLEFEPFENLKFATILNYRTIKSASETFNISYYSDIEKGITKGEVAQSEISFSMDYTPGRKYLGTGLKRKKINNIYRYLYFNYSYGIKGITESDFNYKKIQLFYRHPIVLNDIGTLTTVFEAGKTFGKVPLVLMNTVPGNSSYFYMENSYNMMNYYEFVTDQYIAMRFDHNFKGYIFSKIPLLNSLNLHEIIGFRCIYGSVSEENKSLNASNIAYIAPQKVYWECNIGISNIFNILGISASWRGNYMNLPKAKRLGINFFATLDF